FAVTVTIAPSTSKDLTSFAFLSTDNPGLGVDVMATINGTSIAATVPYGTNVTGLIEIGRATGRGRKESTTVHACGVTPNDFTNSGTLIVAEADNSTKTYAVTVTIAPSMSKDLTSFAFLSTDNPGLGADVMATINGTSIAATVPYGTNVTALI